MSNEMTAADRQALANPHWRFHAEREAHAAFQRTGFSNAEHVAKAFHLLMDAVPREDGLPALQALRRVARTMGALAALPVDDKQALAGVSTTSLGVTVPASNNRAGHARQVARIMGSNPDLASLAADMAQEAERLAERQARMAAAQQAELAARRKRQEEAPGIVAAMAGRGIRLDVEGGRAKAWPRSLLTPDELAALASHAAELPAAIAAEWVA